MNSYIGNINDDKITLIESEAFHCTKVLRSKAGDLIRVIDGKGKMVEAKLTLVGEKLCEGTVTTQISTINKHDYYLHIAIAPTKHIDRTEWFIEKAVEIGIDEITFLKCKNSERTKINLERLNKIAISAVKQSLQAYVPKINDLTIPTEVPHNDYENKLIAYCSNTGIKKKISEFTSKKQKTLIFIGPEGDFTEEEISLSLSNGFVGLNLGDNRLRTETAALYSCASIAALNL